MAWGDDDGMTLYITASTSVFRIRLKIPGVRTDCHAPSRQSVALAHRAGILIIRVLTLSAVNRL